MDVSTQVIEDGLDIFEGGFSKIFSPFQNHNITLSEGNGGCIVDGINCLSETVDECLESNIVELYLLPPLPCRTLHVDRTLG